MRKNTYQYLQQQRKKRTNLLFITCTLFQVYLFSFGIFTAIMLSKHNEAQSYQIAKK